MKNKTIKTLVLATVMLIGLSHVDAVVETDLADKITKNVWSKEQSVELSKEDSITNIAWLQQDAELVAGDYKINAYAADLEEASVESVDKADGVTKNIWAETIKKTDVKEDLISRKAWL